MKKQFLRAAVAAAFLVGAGVASAAPVTSQHAREYASMYHQVAARFGKRTPGCRMVGARATCKKRASDGTVLSSIAVLRRMLGPPPATRAGAVGSGRAGLAVKYSARPVTTTAAPNGLVECIINAESGGNTQAVNSSGHMGEGQWAESTWIADGGGRYASTPLGATQAEQTTIIEQQVAAGNAGQWTSYDPC